MAGEMRAEPRDVVNRMIEEIQIGKKIELCEEIFSEAFVNHTPTPGIPADCEGMRQLVVDRFDLLQQLGLVQRRTS